MPPQFDGQAHSARVHQSPRDLLCTLARCQLQCDEYSSYSQEHINDAIEYYIPRTVFYSFVFHSPVKWPIANDFQFSVSSSSLLIITYLRHSYEWTWVDTHLQEIIIVHNRPPNLRSWLESVSKSNKWRLTGEFVITVSYFKAAAVGHSTSSWSKLVTDKICSRAVGEVTTRGLITYDSSWLQSRDT